MKRDKIKKLSVLTFSSLSVVSTFAIISASCEPIEKVDAPQVVGIESSAPLSNSDVKSQDITIKKGSWQMKVGIPHFLKILLHLYIYLKSLLQPPLLIMKLQINWVPKNLLLKKIPFTIDCLRIYYDKKYHKSATELLNKILFNI
nr:hypothetical protein [Mycoplasmopsis bovis]